MFERIKHMLIKEFIQVFRDPRMRMVIFVIPCIQVLVFGYAVTTDVQHVRTAVYDLDNSRGQPRPGRPASSARATSTCVSTSRTTRRPATLIDRGTGERRAADQPRVRRGPAGRPHRPAPGDRRRHRLEHGRDRARATPRRSPAAISQQLLVERFAAAVGRAARGRAWSDLRTRAWFNENLESRNFFVPGVIVIVVTLVTLLLTSMAVVREKEIGTMEQIMVTPITPAEFILGKTVPFALIGFIDVVLVTLVGVFWFEVPIRGSLLLLLFATALYLMTTLGAGLLISTVSQTQQQAMMTTFFFFFPAMLLSGFVFPIANMPQVVQWLTLVNPLARTSW